MSGRATHQRSPWAHPQTTTTRDRECQFCLSRYRFVEVRPYNSKKYCSKQCSTLDQDELDAYVFDDNTDMTAPATQRPPQLRLCPAQPPAPPAPRHRTKIPIAPALPRPKPQPRPQQPSDDQLKTAQQESDRVYTWVMDAIDELTTASAELSRTKGRNTSTPKPAPRQPAPQHLTLAAARTFIDVEQGLLTKTNNAIRTTRQQIITTGPKATPPTVAPRPKTITMTPTTGLRKPIAFIPATAPQEPRTAAGTTAARPRPGLATPTPTVPQEATAKPEPPSRRPVVRVSSAAMGGSPAPKHDGHHLIIKCMVEDLPRRLETHSLIDCGASGFAFIDKDFAQHHNLPQHSLKDPRRLEVIDG